MRMLDKQSIFLLAGVFFRAASQNQAVLSYVLLYMWMLIKTLVCLHFYWVLCFIIVLLFKCCCHFTTYSVTTCLLYMTYAVYLCFSWAITSLLSTLWSCVKHFWLLILHTIHVKGTDGLFRFSLTDLLLLFHIISHRSTSTWRWR